MGVSYRSISGLPQPFLLFDERIVDIPSGSVLTNRSAAEFKMIILLAGEFLQQVDGGTPFRYRGGDAAIFTGPCLQEITPLDASRPATLHVVRVMFLDDCMVAARKRLERAGIVRDKFQDFVASSFPRTVHLPNFLDEEAGALLRKLREESDRPDAGRRYAVAAMLTEMVIFAARKVDRSRSGEDPVHVSRSAAIVKRVEAFLAVNFGRLLSLEEIAWNQRMSSEHVARVFKEVTGHTVFEHLDALRIDAAKSLLIQPAPTISEIARRCGFASPTRFGIHFKALTGTTPSAYRAELGFRLRAQPSSFRGIKPQR
jgi:AraC-like DNA-binding protein